MPTDPPSLAAPLLPGDLEAVLAIQGACYPAVLREDAAVFRRKLDQFPRGCLGLRRGGTLGAYAFCQPWHSGRILPLGGDAPAEGADCLYLHDLAVLPAWRGTGAAGALLAEVFRLGAACGFGTCALVAVQGAAPFWERQGFRPVRTLDYVPGVTATYMVRGAQDIRKMP